jgi:hypothetical protein
MHCATGAHSRHASQGLELRLMATAGKEPQVEGLTLAPSDYSVASSGTQQSRLPQQRTKTLAAFNLNFCEETDLRLLDRLVFGVIRETMQPAHLSLNAWCEF